MGKRRKNNVLYGIPKNESLLKESVSGYERDIVKRSIQFSLRVIKLYRVLDKDAVGRIIGRQLLRSAMSIGANIQEAQAGQSRADFISKCSIARKEARESSYWLELIQESKILPAPRLKDLRSEIEQIIRILTSIILTSKQNSGR